MNICKQHGKPIGHIPEHVLVDLDSDSICTPPRGMWTEIFWPRPSRSIDFLDPCGESLATWRKLVAQAEAMLTIRERIGDGDGPGAPLETWACLADLYRPGFLDSVLGTIDGREGWSQRLLLIGAVQAWIDLGGVSLRYTWLDGTHPQVIFGTNSMFSDLALQLALSVAKQDGLAICDECGRLYIRQRRNAPGVPKRCRRRECKNAAARVSAAKARARKKQTD